ncbi:MAG: T9SS type A sorting domain-containing protein [Cytophagales bacterium]|nr:T9SS type A sorting domain-containing protein [Cytophagales bacterium]
MKKTVILSLLAGLIFYIINVENVSAQYNFQNPDMTAIAKPGSMEGRVKFKDGSNIDPSIIFAAHKDAFGLSTDDQMVLYRIDTDQLEYSHYRYFQTYKNIKVEGYEYVVHAKDGFAVKANGKIFNGLAISVNPTISESAAFANVINYVSTTFGAASYMWEDSLEEQLLKQITDDPNATYFPTPELVIAPLNGDYDTPANFKLAYKYDIYAQQIVYRSNVYIDAATGNIINDITRILDADVIGTAVTKYSGTQDITTDFTGSGSCLYRLRETGRGNGIETYDMNQGTNYASAVDFCDADNFWDNVNAQQDEVATDAHWGAEMTYDYYFNTFGRDSYDNLGAKILSYVHYGVNYVNAFWDGFKMTYGDGDGSFATPLTSLDVCGHEITHAVNTNTANLIYQKEPGGLSESFSDIFGNTIEKFGKGTINWRLGEEIIVSGLGIRNMANPNEFNDPDTYLGTHWVNVIGCTPTGGGGGNDYCGVHTNSGVQNFWYYLLSEGGSGTNDNGDSYSVTGIGIDKAAAIAFRNLTVYLNTLSDYAEARQFSIESAIDLFGECSNEVNQTIEAWNAVGVYGAEYVQLYDYINYTVAGTETWTTDFVIANTLTIPGGSVLNIQAGVRIQFGPNGKVDVKLSGVLNLDGILTGLDAPCLTMWAGVEVEARLLKGVVHNGFLNMSNSAAIEHSQFGAFGNGKITANSSNFFNNKISVDLKPVFGTNTSSFTGCIFEVTPPLRDGTIGPVTFVKMNFIALGSVKPLFQNNIFRNNDPSILISQKPIAIDAANSRFTALNNTFDDLVRGIWSINTISALDFKLTIRDNTFNDVQSSIRIVGGSFDEIVNNTFTGIALDPNVFRSTNFYGIFLIGTSGFVIEENTFNTVTYGIFCINSGVVGGEIHLTNSFTNCWRDIDARGDNSNLDIKCNIFTGNHASAMNVFFFGGVADIKDQGSCSPSPSKDPAGNEFNSGNWHISSKVPFVYSHHNNCTQYPDVEPLSNKITSNVTKINCGVCKSSQSCCTTGPFCYIPDQIPLQAVKALERAFLQRIKIESNPDDKQLLENKLIIFYIKTNQRDKVIDYLENNSTLAHEKILISSYIQSGEFSKAAQAINSIPLNNIENQKFVQYHNVLLNLGINNKTIYQINGQQELDVRDVSNGTTCISANAQALLKIVFDEDAVLFVPDPDSLLNNARIATTTNELTNELTKENGSAKLINIIPNPFNDETIIKYYVPGTAHSAEIIVYDIVGSQVRSITLNKSKSDVIINASYLDNGIYFIRMIVDNEIVANKKIAVLK